MLIEQSLGQAEQQQQSHDWVALPQQSDNVTESGHPSHLAAHEPVPCECCAEAVGFLDEPE